MGHVEPRCPILLTKALLAAGIFGVGSRNVPPVSWIDGTPALPLVRGP
jgi:hypothetical protein